MLTRACALSLQVGFVAAGRILLCVYPRFCSHSARSLVWSTRGDAGAGVAVHAQDAKPVYNTSVATSTAVINYNASPNDPHRPTSMPIYQSSTFMQPAANELQDYDYTRSGNPTRSALEKLVAGMEGADAAFAFTSGMSALANMTRLLKAGDEILCNADIYGGMFRLLSKVAVRQGIKVRFIEIWDLAKVKAALGPATKMVHVESPSNPLMMVCDLRALAKIIKDHNPQCLLTVDNTILTPLLMKPLELGADVVVHSATKFYGGHADVMAGVVCCKTPELSKQIYFHQNAEGTGLAPFDCWLVMRGMKTMALRVERGQANAVQVVQWLAAQAGAPKRVVKRVHYAGVKDLGLAQDPSEQAKRYAIMQRQTKGAGVLLSFETGCVKTSEKIVSALKLFKITVSFGGTGSVVEMPVLLSHASIPDDELHIPRDLVRISVGIEDINDLLADLRQAFIKAAGSDAVLPSGSRL